MRRFLIDAVQGTLFIIFIIWLLKNVAAFGIFNLFDPIGDALGDMQFTDVVFSRLRETPKADTDVVLVNLGDLNRRGIAQEINIICKYHPKVIGLDARFLAPKPDTIGDMMLQGAIINAKETSSIVLGCKLVGYNNKTNLFDSINYSIPMFSDNATYNSYVNLPTDNTAQSQDAPKTTRSFTPYYNLKGNKNDKKLSFAVQLAKIYSPEKAQQFLDRRNATEVIDYRGNFVPSGYDNKIAQQFFALDVNDVFNENFVPSVLKNKIVLIGFMGSSFANNSKEFEDKFYTPMNNQYAGKAYPDMYGVVVWANIISMILHQDYVNVLPAWLEASIGLIIVFLTNVLFSYIYRRLSRWYDGLTVIIQMLEILILLFLIILVFNKFNLKLNLTLAFVGIGLAQNALEVYFSIILNLFSKEGRASLLTSEEE